MNKNTDLNTEQFLAAPLPNALAQRLLQTAKLAQSEAMLDHQTEEVLMHFHPAPLSAAQQARLDNSVPRLPLKEKKPFTPSKRTYHSKLAKVASILLFIGLISLVVTSALNFSHKKPNELFNGDFLAGFKDRQSIEHFAPVGIAKRDIVEAKPQAHYTWENAQAYQSYKIIYQDTVSINLDDETSVIISVPQEKELPIQVPTL